jgi:anti-sigma regulatory factor (Ser/Thr protein kinase)
MPDAAHELSIRADAADVRPASEWLARACEVRGVPERQTLRLDLCLNEALANVIAHGGEQALASPVVLRLEVSGEAAVRQACVTVLDSGPAFDMTAAEPGVLPMSLSDADPGGLGLTMIRNLSDSLSYRRLDGRNELVFGVRWGHS